MNKTLSLAIRGGLSEEAIQKLGFYFEDMKIEGLFMIADGREGQKIMVCEDYCTIETTSTFEYKEVNKAFKRVMSGKRGVSSAITDYDIVQFIGPDGDDGGRRDIEV